MPTCCRFNAYISEYCYERKGGELNHYVDQVAEGHGEADKWYNAWTMNYFYANQTGNVYAAWSQNYGLTYDANGGENAPAAQTGNFGVNDQAETNEGPKDLTVGAAPTREGYTFLGWKDGETTYQPGDTVQLNSETPFKTLVAEWKKDTTSIPWIPLEPAKPVETADTPDNPDTPDTPETPDTPDTPATPDTPETPDKPETPDAPDTPTTPDTPTSPKKPVTPGDKNTGKTPDAKTQTPSKVSTGAKATGGTTAGTPKTGDAALAVGGIVATGSALLAGSYLLRRKKH